MFLVEHLYFLASLYFLFFWVIFFFYFKDKRVRKRILISSLACLILTPLTELICLGDWWQPHFIHTGFLHVEDLLFGFSVGGVISALYHFVVKKWENALVSYRYKTSLALFTLIVIFGSYYLLKISSFWAFSIGLLLTSILIVTRTPKTIIPMVKVGILFLLIAIPGYLIGLALNPDWIRNEWLLTGLPGIIVLSIPLGEYIWYFIAGTTIAGFQKLMN